MHVDTGVGFYSALSLPFVDSNTSVDRNQVWWFYPAPYWYAMDHC